MMQLKKRRALESAGWTFGDASDFLELPREDREMVEFRLALVRRLHERRRASKMTQAQLARKMRSSQPRVAKIEANDPGVSLDLLLRGLWAAGGGLADVAVATKESLQRLRPARRKSRQVG